MVVIPTEYYTEEKEVKLTQYEIEMIIEELKRVQHDIFEFQGYDKLIKKLNHRGLTENKQEKRANGI